MERSLLKLDPAVQGRFGEMLRLAAEDAVPMLLSCTLRTDADQEALWAKGRTEPGPIVTHARAGQSWHNYGRAIDAVPWEYYKALGPEAVMAKKLDWSPFVNAAAEKLFREQRISLKAALDGRWLAMVLAGDALGIEWAGRWPNFVEYCHWQITDGLTLAQAKAART